MPQQNWKIKRESKFEKQYKLIGRTRQMKVDNAIAELAMSSNPAELGVYKPSMRTFSYELGRGDRIIFDINYADHTIMLLRVCDHKSAYGMD